MEDMLKIGSSCTKTITAREETILSIAKVSGDMNPIHLNDEYAKQSKFGKRIAHALFCINGISMIIGNYLPGNGTVLLSQSFKYMKPVYINDTIEITVEVVKILPQNKYLLRTSCKNQLGDIVLDGESMIKWKADNR